MQEHITTGWDRFDTILLNRVREARKTTETVNIRGVEIECIGTWEQSDEGEQYLNIEEIKCSDVLGLVLERINLDQINEAIISKYE